MDKISRGVRLKKICIGLGMIVFLSSCGTSKIHLFTQGLEPVELDRLSLMLRSEGFKVKLNELQPPEFDSATIISSPAHPKFSDIDRILVTLSEIGYSDIELVAIAKENNSYTGKNIGLCLGKSSPIRNTKHNEYRLPTDFSGYCHAGDAYLTLKPGKV